MTIGQLIGALAHRELALYALKTSLHCAECDAFISVPGLCGCCARRKEKVA